MSEDGLTIKQRADAEGDAAEAETPEPEPEPTPELEPEPEPPAPEPASDGEAEKAWISAEKASASYGKRIAGLLDPHAPQLAECPLCLPNLRGYIDTNDAGRLPEDIVAVVRSFLGDTAEADYKPSPTHRRCDHCDGLGKVKTGSLVPNYDVLACGQCKGSGFLPPPGGSSNGSAEHEPALVPVTPDGYEAPKGDTDPWGSPRLLENGLENPNWGRMPQFKSATLP